MRTRSGGVEADGERSAVVVPPQQAIEIAPAIEKTVDDHRRVDDVEGDRHPLPVAEGAQARPDGVAPRRRERGSRRSRGSTAAGSRHRRGRGRAARRRRRCRRDCAHAVFDWAGWYGSRSLVVPSGITLAPLPPYAPELNPRSRSLAVPARVLPLAPAVCRSRCHHRRLLQRLEPPYRRARPHRLTDRLSLPAEGQDFMRWV